MFNRIAESIMQKKRPRSGSKNATIHAPNGGWVVLFLALFVMLAAGALTGDRDRGITERHAPVGRDETLVRTGKNAQQEALQINLNEADEDLLLSLPGIGEARAAAIVAHREAIGGFSSIEELRDVSGIGEKTLESLRGWVFIGE